MSEITNDEVAKAMGWIKTYKEHSQSNKTTPYWDDDGGFMGSVWSFKPTTEMYDAIDALTHLIDSEKITNTEVCKLICEFIMSRKEQL